MASSKICIWHIVRGLYRAGTGPTLPLAGWGASYISYCSPLCKCAAPDGQFCHVIQNKSRACLDMSITLLCVCSVLCALSNLALGLLMRQVELFY